MPLLRKLRVEKPLRAVYEGMHAYRGHPWLLVGVTVLTLAIQAVRVLAIWMTAKAVGVDLSPRVYYVMGPLLFLVMLVPFTINGLAVREAFFVSFLGQLGVSADAAFATGFLFFLVTVVLALPGAVILAWEGVRGTSGARAPAARTQWLSGHGCHGHLNGLPGSSSAWRAFAVSRPSLVDHGSTDGTLELVRERFPEVRVIEQENKGLGAGLNAGMRAAPARYHLLINSDAWLTGGGASSGSSRSPTRTPTLRSSCPRLAQPRRVAATLGARLPDAVAASRPSTSSCASSRPAPTR